MNKFETNYTSIVPIETYHPIEKDISISKHMEFEGWVYKEPEKESINEKSTSENIKEKPKKIYRKSNKAAVESVQN